MYASDKLKRTPRFCIFPKWMPLNAMVHRSTICLGRLYRSVLGPVYYESHVRCETFSLIGAGAKRLRNEFETDITISKFICLESSELLSLTKLLCRLNVLNHIIVNNICSKKEMCANPSTPLRALEALRKKNRRARGSRAECWIYTFPFGTLELPSKRTHITHLYNLLY